MKVSAKTIKCDCGGTARKGTAARTFKIGGLRTEVKDIPAFICDSCGEVYFHGPSIVKIETKLERQQVVAV